MANAGNVREPLSQSEIKDVVDQWIDILKIPSISEGYFREDDNFLNVNTKWSVDDVAKNDRVSFSKTFSVLKSSIASGKPIIAPSASVAVNEKLSVVSQSGEKRAILVEQAKNGDPTSKSEYLQIWNEDTLLKTYNLTELDLHKTVYTTAALGVTMTWNGSETKLAYVAEKKVPKAKSFYTSAASPVKISDESMQKKNKADAIGEEYVYKQSWGEQLTDSYFSVIVVLDLSTDEFKVLPLPEEQFPTDLQWVGDTHIIGTTYPIPVWRLGLIYCSNRESLIFSIHADGANFQLLSGNGKASFSPRVRPDNNFVVWQERVVDGAHDRARSIIGLALNKGQPTGEPQLLYSSSPLSQMPVYENFSRNCWSSDGTKLYVVTPNEAARICLEITLSPSVQVKKIENVDSLLWATKEYLLVTSSTTISSPFLKLLSISQDYQPINITQPTEVVDFQTIKQIINSETSPPAFYYGPAIESVPPNSVPLVVNVHGGPHICFTDTFAHEIVFFLKLGFAVLRVNYVGSTGGVKDTADELLGKIGDKDVKDCQLIVNKVLTSTPCLNPNQVVLFGGSHGGFLSCHLSSAYPDVYKAAVMRNPVTDVGTMVGTTDITDWVYAESGVPFPQSPVQTLIPTARDLVDAQKYITASPIHHVEKVKAATLLLLGSEDRRVPFQQGLCYYRALKAYDKIAEVRMYPDSHPLNKVAVRMDSILHASLWFKRFLR